MAIHAKMRIETVEAVLDIIKSTLASGDDVLITSFGKFCVKRLHARAGTLQRVRT